MKVTEIGRQTYEPSDDEKYKIRLETRVKVRRKNSAQNQEREKR